MTIQTDKPLLFDYFETSANLLFSEYERSKLQQASANIGDNRELFCNQFLSRVLPSRLTVRKGEIWDNLGQKTGQLDTIIIRDDTPSLVFGDSDTYFVEGVFSVIEVKSKLTRGKLKEAIRTLKPLSSLKMHFEGLSIFGTDSKNVIKRPLRCVFAYEGATWETLTDELLEQKELDLIDLICILDRGAMVHNGIYFDFQDEDILYGIFKGKAVALGMLYFLLATFTTTFIARNVSVRPYFEPFIKWTAERKWISVYGERTKNSD